MTLHHHRLAFVWSRCCRSQPLVLRPGQPAPTLRSGQVSGGHRQVGRRQLAGVAVPQRVESSETQSARRGERGRSERSRAATKPGKSVGQSAVALTDNNRDAALAAARIGRLAATRSWPRPSISSGSCSRRPAITREPPTRSRRRLEINPQMAYAHYYAGMNFYEAKRDRSDGCVLREFLKLAPNAPERPAVESIMRTCVGSKH